MSASKGQLIVSLDVSTRAEAETIVRELGDAVRLYKIGYQLVFGDHGLDLARDLLSERKRVFLDMKLLDIDNTVAKGVEGAARMGVSMLTLHAYPKAMRAAVAAAHGSDLTLLGVTVLTSMDAGDLMEAGYAGDPQTLVMRRAEQALATGMGGIVCSAEEARRVRAIVGPDLSVVTPGIRPSGAERGDQKRVMTPADALRAGASHLVVGRPIVGARNRREAADVILADMASATS